MKRVLPILLLAAALAATGGLALARQSQPDAPPAAGMRGPGMGPGTGHDGAMQGMRHRRVMHRGMGRHHGPVGAVIGDLRQLTRLYMMEGKPDQLEGLYKDVLARTRNPMVRNFAYDALARLQARPRNTSAAIATLRKSLDENLERVNAMPARKR